MRLLELVGDLDAGDARAAFRIDAAGELREIGGKTAKIEEIEGQYMGLLKLTPTAWSAVEELLGIEIPATFSPKGGYDSAEACINDLMSEAKAAWTEGNEGKDK